RCAASPVNEALMESNSWRYQWSGDCGKTWSGVRGETWVADSIDARAESFASGAAMNSHTAYRIGQVANLAVSHTRLPVAGSVRTCERARKRAICVKARCAKRKCKGTSSLRQDWTWRVIDQMCGNARFVPMSRGVLKDQPPRFDSGCRHDFGHV